MVFAEALAAVPYCMATQHPPYYRGSDGAAECTQNYRQASISTPVDCGSNDDGGCFWNNAGQTYAADLGTVDLSLAPGMAARDTESFSFTASLKPGWTTGAAKTLLSYGNTEWLSGCLLYTSPSPRDATLSRMPSSA